MKGMHEHRVIEAEAAAWLARRDASEQWTAADDQALAAWVAESAAHRVAWLRLDAAWQRAARLPAVASSTAGSNDGESQSAPAAITSRVDRLRTRYRRRAIVGWSLAASLALGIGVAWMLRFYPLGVERYATEVGGREAVTLADGSRVTLNTHTRGRALVNQRERRFWLDEGEAFFEVEHDPSRPFVILAGKDRVTVLGTKFSVRHEDGRTEVTVVEGRVQLDRASTGGVPVTPVVMGRNEAAVTQAGSVLVLDRSARQVQDELSWRQGHLAFDQLTLGEVAAEFNRYNRTQLVVEGEAANLKVSGNFDAQNVEGFARLAHEGFGLRVVRDGDRIVLTQ